MLFSERIAMRAFREVDESSQIAKFRDETRKKRRGRAVEKAMRFVDPESVKAGPRDNGPQDNGTTGTEGGGRWAVANR
jgi:hypothetical protein